VESYYKPHPKTKTFPEFKDELSLISSALPEKAIDNAVKGYRKRLPARVLANDGNFEYIM